MNTLEAICAFVFFACLFTNALGALLDKFRWTGHDQAPSVYIEEITIPIIIACIICTILVRFVFQANYRNTITLSFIYTFAILMLDFFFSYILAGHKNVFMVFFKTVFLSSCYSVLFSVLYYRIIFAIQSRFKKFDAR